MEPSWRPWTPEPYQLRGSAFLQGQGAAVLWLDPGMRKTSIVLHAFCALKAAGAARKMLVVAPKRVCELVWRQEAAKWEEFRHLRVVLLHGPKKAKILAEDADVYLINPEGVVWLAKQFASRPGAWPFDIVTFDELTKFKHSQAERSKALRGKAVGGRPMPNLLKHAQRRWGMTGTPNPNGYLDLFGQFLLLDDGAALGRFVTHYRDQYFSVGFNGFDYDLQPGGEKRVQERLRPYVFALDSADYLTLPEVIDDIIEIELEPAARAAYDAMRQDMVAHLEDGIVEAANTAAAYTKLSQMAGGAVYMPDGSVQEIHTAKLDALSDLIDELQGQQLLIGYEYDHEKERMRARFGARIAFLSDARTSAQAEEMQRAWNAGTLQILACHPASAGHGLNLQEGNARHLCWFGPIWDLELWEQFVRRLRRSGNTATHILRHIMVVRHSIDELKLQAVAEKDTSQSRLKSALATVLSGAETDFRSQDMVMKLQRAGATAPAATERKAPAGWGSPKTEAATAAEQPQTQVAPATEERRAPSGWGAPKGAAPSDVQEQRAAIQEKLNPEQEPDTEATAGFRAEVIALKSQIEGGEAADEAPFDGGQPVSQVEQPVRTTRTRGSKSVEPANVIDLDAVRQAIREELSANTAATQSPESEAAYASERRVYNLSSLISSLHTACVAAAAVGALNPEAGAEVYTLGVGAVEAELKALGYGQ